MALDLYVNFERYSNSSTFYRTALSSLDFIPTSITLKVVDPELSENAGVVYDAEYSFNSGQFEQMDINNYGEIVQNFEFDTSSPCICAIKVKVYQGTTVAATFEMFGVYLSAIPSVDFIVYPENYINESQRTFVELTPQNYVTSPGPKFYGEGHTQIMLLSCTTSTPPTGDVTATWFVGNSSNSPFITSDKTVIKSGHYTSSVAISSVIGDIRQYPVSIRITTEDIQSDGPVITYDDVTGLPRYYPFFSSTLDLSSRNINLPLKGHITVNEYPLSNPPTVVNPFESDLIVLPLDGTPQLFRSILYNPRPLNLLTETYIGSKWFLEGLSDSGDWSVETRLLTSIVAYDFKIGYDDVVNDLMLPAFKASPVTQSLLMLSVSAIKDIRINMPPYDWQPKRVTYVTELQTIVGPQPYAKMYIPSYYYLRGQDVPLTIVDAPEAPFELHMVTVESSQSANSLILSAGMLSGVMQFQNTGPVDLKVISTVVNPNNGIMQNSTIVYDNMIEIVPYLDLIDENYFLTSITPLTLTYKEAPRLSPNEWAIADNINSIIQKIYTTAEEISDYTVLYENASKLYGWIGPVQRFSAETDSIGENCLVYLWADLECETIEAENYATWAAFECNQIAKCFQWETHFCKETQKQIDPTCIQRHCLDWRWKSRKQGFGNVNATWKMTKQKGLLPKRWAYEKCEYDSLQLNCNRDIWRIESIDPLYFPIPSCTKVNRCNAVDVEFYPKTEHLLYALPTEIILLQNDYFGTLAIRRGIADEAFAFQDIVGVAISLEGKVIVLDSVLCRVSVFDVILDPPEFRLFASWGTYGNADNPRGFNKPGDVHIDVYDSIWIADTGNKCVKKLTMLGKHSLTIQHENFDSNPPLSVCVDSKLNVHCLTNSKVIVFDQYGEFSFEYVFSEEIINVKKINTSYNREMVYITHENGVIKYFRTGIIAYDVADNIYCKSNKSSKLTGFSSISQDKYRNLYVTVDDKILKIADLQKLVTSRALLPNLYWNVADLLIHKEEYIQPWVYLKSFHRLWDNIELIRNSLAYEASGCKTYKPPVYKKEDLVIGQNEIVTNAVVNRLSEQLWANITTMLQYFNVNCEK